MAFDDTKATGDNLTASEYNAMVADQQSRDRTAFKVVAASGTTPQYLSAADYVCDKTADDVQINAALTDVGDAGGGEVHLTDGIFDITAHLNIPNNTNLRGTGWNTTLVVANGTDDDIIRNSDIVNGNSCITISDMAFEGNKHNQTTRGYGIYFKYLKESKILNVRSKETYQISFALADGCSNVEIAGCYAEKDRLNGIRLTDTWNALVHHNEVFSASSMGMFMDYSTLGCNHNTVDHNKFRYCGLEGFGAEAGCDQNLIIGNTSDHSSDNGFSVSGDKNTLANNFSWYNDYHGIYVAGSHNTVVGNTVFENSQDGDNTYDGIRIDGNACYNNVQMNTVRHMEGTNQHKYGINVDDATCESNVVAFNDLYRSGKTANWENDGIGTVTYTTPGNRGA